MQLISSAPPGRLSARPEEMPAEVRNSPTGMHPLGLGERRDGMVYVPESYDPAHPAPLLVLLHGAGGNGRNQIAPFQDFAEQAGMIVLGPDSRLGTWDVLVSGFGPDIEFLDQAMATIFRRFTIDTERIAVGGFSDGASYALSVGLTNGDLFHRILAFSPGFMQPGGQRGDPLIYVSHGTEDQVLPVERCSRRIVPALRRAGYEVFYHEFEGGHSVPVGIAQEAFDWLREAGGREPMGAAASGEGGTAV
jgi:phospholipase/carboxylesterase